MHKREERNENGTGRDATYSHVLRYTGIFGGVQGLKTLASVARVKLTTWLLGPVGFGLISVYNTISEFVVCCSNLGLPVNATRETSELAEDGSQTDIERLVCVIRSCVLWTAVLAAVVCAALSPLLSYFFFEHDAGHYSEVIWLVPVVVALVIAEAEASLLKGLHKLHRLAMLETVAAVASIFLTVPFYYLWGIHGIMVSLIVWSAVSCIIHLFFSVRVVPYRVRPFDLNVLRAGLPMLRRGIPFVVAAVAQAASGMIVVKIIKEGGQLEDVGLYRAGFMIMVTYAGLAFAAIEADFFPRLASVNHDVGRMNNAINRQVDVCVMLITPLLILLLMFMPLAIRILTSSSFMVVVSMTVAASFSVFLRSIVLPLSYTSLARGAMFTFLVMELLSVCVFVGTMWVCYGCFGLLGAGISLSLTSLYDLIITSIVFRWLFGCRIGLQTWKNAAVYFVLLTITVAVCFQNVAWLKWVGCGAMFAIATYRSLSILRRKTKSLES